MKIFIQDIPVNIVTNSEPFNIRDFDLVIESHENPIAFGDLGGDILIENSNAALIDKFLLWLKQKRPKKIDEITFSVNDYESVIDHVKGRYTIIKAAGGLVLKEGEILLIYRLDKWDLPKGKLDPGEKSKEGALREVEEECNIKVKMGKKICSTWHTYKSNGQKILKKTNWYTMICTNDDSMKPQIEENITNIKWMNDKEIKQSLYNSYASIRFVFREYYKLF